MNKKLSIEAKKNMVLEYLNNKYGEEFEGLKYKPAQLMQGHDEFYVYPKKGTKEDGFQVWGYYKDGTYKMRDGYFGVFIHDEYEKTIREIVDAYLSEYMLDVSTTQAICPERLNKNTKINEIYNVEEFFSPTVNLYVKSSIISETDLERMLDKVAKELIEKKLMLSFTAYRVPVEKYDNSSSVESFIHDPKEDTKYLFEGKYFFINQKMECNKQWEAK